MIWFVYGIPRTGKSLFGGLVDGILPAIKDGRQVFTNIPGLSLAAISKETNKTVFQVKQQLHKIDKIGDILQCFDYRKNRVKDGFPGSFFVIDEFRAITGLNDKTSELLSIFLNSAGKEVVDFVFIAQLPSYFDSDIRALGEGCTVYERGDSMGRRNHSIEYKFDRNAGTPVKVGKKWDTEIWSYRYRDPRYFLLYSSYPDEQFLKQNGGETHRVLTFWQKKSFKIACFVVVVVIVIICILLYLISSTTSTLNSLSTTKQAETPTTVEAPTFDGFADFQETEKDTTDCFISTMKINQKQIYFLRSGRKTFSREFEECVQLF